MIIFVLLFTAAVTVMTVTDTSKPGQKTSKELYREGLERRK